MTAGSAIPGVADPWAHIQPWDRQPGETHQQHANFSVYRDLGRTRTVKKAAEVLGRSVTHVHKSCWSGDWVRRAAAWDTEQDRVYLLSTAELRRETAQRHVKIAGAMLAKVVERLNTVDVSKLSMRDLGYWVEVAVRVQRQALGESTDKVAVEGGMEVAHIDLTPAEAMDRLREVQAEIGRRVTGAATPASD